MKDGNKISREFDKFIPGSMNLEFKQKGEINLVNLFLADIFIIPGPCLWFGQTHLTVVEGKKKLQPINFVSFFPSSHYLSLNIY